MSLLSLLNCYMEIKVFLFKENIMARLLNSSVNMLKHFYAVKLFGYIYIHRCVYWLIFKHAPGSVHACHNGQPSMLSAESDNLKVVKYWLIYQPGKQQMGATPYKGYVSKH